MIYGGAQPMNRVFPEVPAREAAVADRQCRHWQEDVALQNRRRSERNAAPRGKDRHEAVEAHGSPCLRNFGLKIGAVAKGRFEARVRELTDGNPMLEAAADPILRVRGALRSELAGLEWLTRDHANADPACRLMMTMPDVGAIVALTAKSDLDDPDRFRSSKDAADKLVGGIKRKTRKHDSAEEKIRIVLAGLRGEESIAALCRREGIAVSPPSYGTAALS